MNNITTNISFSIYSNKGVYALFLGSGISKPSGIPTGWDIVTDLIKKLAILNKDKCTPTPEEWFKNKYSEEPDYSNILSKLVKTPSERVNFLKSYFEPNEQEREQNLKQPTIAHRNIAKLVKDGYIKLIITTNFDRLIESALQRVGIEPTVVRHPNDIDGIVPLVHSDFTLVKINGDYLDSRFLNTKEELAKYDEKLHSFLLRIFNEFGIISSGWSAKWDSGLVNILRQSENYRFSSFWTYLGTCEKELLEISNHRKGHVVEIKDADSFFVDIVEKIEALEKINDNHPLTTDIALARLKNYILKDESKILLYDLLLNEREKTYKKINQNIDFSQLPNSKNILPRLASYEASIEILLRLVIDGVFWGKPEHNQYFIDIISRISEPPLDSNGTYFPDSKRFHYYPSMLLLYSLGISAIKVRKFDLMNSCFRMEIADHQHEYSDKSYLLQKVNPCAIDRKLVNQIISQNYKTPLSTYINNKLRPYFQTHIVNDNDFNNYFDAFEYFLSLNYMFNVNIGWAPWGQYQWRNNGFRKSIKNILTDLIEEAEHMKNDWLPLKSGMFDRDYNKYIQTKKKLDDFLKDIYF